MNIFNNYILQSIYNNEELNDTLDLKRVAIYTRNDEEEYQEKVCKEILKDSNYDFSSINLYKDTRKGLNMKSYTMEQLLEDIKQQKIDTIMCLSVDRITRSIVELEYFLALLRENNVRLLLLH